MHGVLKNNFLHGVAIFCGALFCLTGFVDPPIALLIGIGLSYVISNPFIQHTRTAAQRLLQFSVVGLGFGMNLFDAIQVSKEGLTLTVCSIMFTLLFGLILGKMLSINRKTSWLISFGTAICGGSAIAAISPIIDARQTETSVALGIIFMLNSIALILFPYVGDYLDLSQNQFGMWAAIAIHDTSSVVGAAQKYGDDALHIATTVKLGRALWIIPFSIILTFIYSRKNWNLSFPFFIFFFIAAVIAHTFIPQLNPISLTLITVAKKGFTLALFFIGAGLPRIDWKLANSRPLILGIILWIIISSGSLYVIVN